MSRPCPDQFQRESLRAYTSRTYADSRLFRNHLIAVSPQYTQPVDGNVRHLRDMTKTDKKTKNSKAARAVAKRAQKDADSDQPAAKPVSLKPLEFEEAMRDLLEVSPDDKRNREGAGGRPQKG